MSDQFNVGDSVNCSESPGQKFEIIEALGYGDSVQYMLKDSDGAHYGYVDGGSLKLC